MKQELCIESIQFHDTEKGLQNVEIQGSIFLQFLPEELAQLDELSKKLELTLYEFMEGRIKYRINKTELFDLKLFL